MGQVQWHVHGHAPAAARALILQWRDCRVHHVRRGGQVREEEGGQLGEERRPGEEGRPCEEGRPGEERPGEEGTILVVVLALTVALVATRVARAACLEAAALIGLALALPARAVEQSLPSCEYSSGGGVGWCSHG